MTVTDAGVCVSQLCSAGGCSNTVDLNRPWQRYCSPACSNRERQRRHKQRARPPADPGREMREWWLERYSLDEIREMAAALDVLSTQQRVAA